MATIIHKLLILALVICECASAHHLRHHGGDSSTRSLQPQSPDHLPYGYKKLDKMMNKAILQIILGDLHPSDVLLLKALNYTLEEVMAIREHELGKLKQQQQQQQDGAKYQVQRRAFQRDAAALDSYNKQAVYDYENAAQAQDEQDRAATEYSLRQSFDQAMEPHVVFKVRYDDSEFDSASDERAKNILKNHRTKTIFKLDRGAASSATGESFQVDGGDLGAAAASPSAAALEASTARNLEEFNKQAVADYENLVPNGEREFANQEDFERSMNDTNGSTTRRPGGGEYEGLEWIGDDVYRVVPEAMEAMLNYEDPEQIATIEAMNDTVEFQNDADEGNFTENANLTEYQRMAMAQRKDQGEKAIEDIKMRILAMTGRFNQTTSPNQVQREKLTMFSPTCQTPRNTDAEAWSDPYLMNMHFQLNLTSGEHVLAAKLRLYKLPQESLVSSSTSSSSSSGGNGGSIYEEDEEDEKKIRVSVYFYTKSLKKHRVKKRLMDSIVISLTSQGSHLALDVRQALRFWRPNAQQQHSSNHGLVVQVEDQDGRALKPALYIQEPNCQTAPGYSSDDKAYQFVPALFIRACTRYVRFVNGKMEMYVQCRQRH